MIHGIDGVDVASFQGQPRQWATLAGPIQFGAVKFTEVQPSGVHYVDPDAAADWAFLRGKPRIAYLFGHPATSPAVSVAVFAAAVHAAGGLADADMVCLDLEVTDGRTPAAVARWADTVCSMLAKAFSRPPVVYTFLSFAAAGNCAGLGRYPLWIADPSSPKGRPRVPAPWTSWVIHQYSQTGGIDRDVAAYPTGHAMGRALGKPAPRPVPPNRRPVTQLAVRKLTVDAGVSLTPSWTEHADDGVKVRTAFVAPRSEIVRAVVGLHLTGDHINTVISLHHADGQPVPGGEAHACGGGMHKVTTRFRAHEGDRYRVSVTNYGPGPVEVDSGYFDVTTA